VSLYANSYRLELDGEVGTVISGILQMFLTYMHMFTECTRCPGLRFLIDLGELYSNSAVHGAPRSFTPRSKSPITVGNSSAQSSAETWYPIRTPMHSLVSPSKSYGPCHTMTSTALYICDAQCREEHAINHFAEESNPTAVLENVRVTQRG
jgi:hypothetical protein